MIPQLKWKISIGGAQTTDEVIFEGLDGTLGGIDLVIVGFNELDGWCISFCGEDIKNGCEGVDDVVTLC